MLQKNKKSKKYYKETITTKNQKSRLNARQIFEAFVAVRFTKTIKTLYSIENYIHIHQYRKTPKSSNQWFSNSLELRSFFSCHPTLISVSMITHKQNTKIK